jgi:hypothetical protein
LNSTRTPGFGDALRPALTLATAFLALSCAWIAVAEEPGSPAAPSKLVARPPGGLNLLLTQSEMREWVRNYERETGQDLTSPIDDDEVLVTAPGVRAPMRDVSQAAWGGIAAPFWALANPKDAWRILVPIPPKGAQPDERPAPDPR